MEEFKIYIETLKTIIDRWFNKEMVFYNNDGTWYSRYHSKNITSKELTEWVLNLSQPEEDRFDDE